MKIDFDHLQGSIIAETELSILNEKQNMQLIEILKPEFHQDGNMFCFTYPNRNGLPNDCVQGFGETPIKAAYDFNKNFYSRKAQQQEGGVKDGKE